MGQRISIEPRRNGKRISQVVENLIIGRNGLYGIAYTELNDQGKGCVLSSAEFS